MSLPNPFHREVDPVLKSLSRVNGDGSLRRLNQAMERLSTETAERHAVELGKAAGTVVELDFISGERIEAPALSVAIPEYRNVRVLSDEMTVVFEVRPQS